MRILIVDDERLARERLRRMLALEAGIDAIAEAADGHAALRCLPDFRPDALLLDVEMPELSGIELAASLPAPAPLVVFVTAYDEYALRAFDANAIDYLLKPFDRRACGGRWNGCASAMPRASAPGPPPRPPACPRASSW